jgi:cell division septal protein FtsQ
VAGIETSVDLPHGLEVEVIERRPVATVERPDGEPVPVAADGTLLPSFRADHSLPPLPGEAPEGTKVTDEDTVATLAAVAGAPPELARRIEAVEPGEGGLTALIADGPAVVLGDASRVKEKWTAAAAVLAQADGASAAYIDVRHPQRPAVGG